MKRIVSVICILALALTFSSCGAKEKEKASEVDLEYLVKSGKMPECDFSLGESTEDVKYKIKSQYTPEDSEEDGDFEGYSFTEGNETALIDSGTFYCYYYKNNESNGISYIVNFDKAYGFEIGTVYTEITSAFSEFKYKEEGFTDNNSFFVLGANDGKVVSFEFSKNTVAFIFVDNALYATALYRTDEWNS